VAPITFGFTTTPRSMLSDAVNNGGKLGATATAAMTDRELQRTHQLIANMFELLRVSNIDATATMSGSLTSGSIVTVTLTV
jgi:hypothetical protein